MKNLQTKQQIRSYHKKIRDCMTERDVEEKSRLICARVLESRQYLEASLLYGYYPLGNEVNVLPVLGQALREGKRVALPRTGEGCQMDFYQIASLSQVTEGRFHVMEPGEGCELVSFAEGVMLVPGVVFDRTGSRYGYGKGYYDRYLARFDNICRISTAYEHQLEEKLAAELTDQKMHVVCTEKAWYQIVPDR